MNRQEGLYGKFFRFNRFFLSGALFVENHFMKRIPHHIDHDHIPIGLCRGFHDVKSPANRHVAVTEPFQFVCKASYRSFHRTSCIRTQMQASSHPGLSNQASVLGSYDKTMQLTYHYSLASRDTISIPVTVALRPWLPDLAPERSIACSIVSVVRMPKLTGTPELSETEAIPPAAFEEI